MNQLKKFCLQWEYLINVFCACMKNSKYTYPRQHKILNKRSELFCKCCHENKYLLKIFRVNEKGQFNILTEGKTLLNWFNESLLVKPSHKKNYLADDCVSMKLRGVNK